MGGNFTEIFHSGEARYIENSPVLIRECTLQKDNRTGGVFARVKLQNMSHKTIVFCKVTVWAYGESGAEYPGIGSFSYAGLQIPHRGCFGENTPIFLPYVETASVEAAVTEVVFADRTSVNMERTLWTPVQIPEEKEKPAKQPEPEVQPEAENMEEVPQG